MAKIKPRVLQEVKTNDPHKIVRVQAYYNLGGMNYFTGKVEQRGIYLSVVPVEIKDGYEAFMAFTGYKQCVVEMKRFSQRTLDQYHPDSALVQRMVDRVMVEQKLGEPQ